MGVRDDDFFNTLIPLLSIQKEEGGVREIGLWIPLLIFAALCFSPGYGRNCLYTNRGDANGLQHVSCQRQN